MGVGRGPRMMVQGKVVSQTLREGDNEKGHYKLAVLNVLDESLNDIVEVTRFLKPGEQNPFVALEDGARVEIPARRISVFRFRVQADAA